MMDHAEATRANAVEQYLLGQLTEADQGRFEEHYFSCLECASDVKAGTAFLANLKVVLKETPQTVAAVVRPERDSWFSFNWLKFRWAPLAATAALASVTLYQNVVQIPSLRGKADTELPVLSMAITKPVSASRAGGSITFSRASGIISFTVLEEWDEAYPKYSAELIRDGKVLGAAEASGEAGGLTVTIPARSLEPGSYTLTINGVQQGNAPKTVGRIPITVTP